MLCIILTNKADDCSDGHISNIQLRSHAASRLCLHCDVLIGRDTVDTHHPMAIIESLRRKWGQQQKVCQRLCSCVGFGVFMTSGGKFVLQPEV